MGCCLGAPSEGALPADPAALVPAGAAPQARVAYQPFRPPTHATPSLVPAVSVEEDEWKGVGEGGRRLRLRQELVVLQPVLRALFAKQLPDTRCTFVLRRDDDVDATCLRYLGSLLDGILRRQGALVVPLNTTGDGSCLLHAVSRAVWGIELFSGVLRAEVHRELTDNGAWYSEKAGQEEWEAAVQQAALPSAYLSNIHCVAAAHVLRRPLAVFASDADVLALGTGFWGCAGLFLPSRLRAEEVATAMPVAVAWQSPKHDHYVPLVWVGGACADDGSDAHPVLWPRPELPLIEAGVALDAVLPDPFAPDEDASDGPAAILEGQGAELPELVTPQFVQELVAEIKEAYLLVEAHISCGGAMESLDMQKLLPAEHFAGPPTTTRPDDAEGAQERGGAELWRRFSGRWKFERLVSAGDTDHDHMLQRMASADGGTGDRIGFNDGDCAFSVALAHSVRSVSRGSLSVGKVAEVAATLMEHRRQARFESVVGAVMRANRAAVASAAGLADGKRSAQRVALAIVRSAAELRLLRGGASPVEGVVSVERSAAEPLLWAVALEGGRAAELRFPSGYPDEPPTATLDGEELGAAGLLGRPWAPDGSALDVLRALAARAG